MHPVLFTLGPYRIGSYYVFFLLGFLALILAARWRAGQLGLPKWRITLLCGIQILAGLAGARLGYVAEDWGYYRLHTEEIIRVHDGGMSFYWGVIAAALCGILYIRKAQLPFWRVVDLMIPPLVIGQALARVGCFMAGCCSGVFALLPWAVSFDPNLPPRHPTQLYEAGFLFALFLLFKRWERRNPPAGTLFYSYGLLYGLFRLTTDFLRAEMPKGWTGLSSPQQISVVLILLFARPAWERWRRMSRRRR